MMVISNVNNKLIHALALINVAHLFSLVSCQLTASVTFNPPSTTNAAQQWTVPLWVSEIDVQLYGQPGQNSYFGASYGTGGQGGYTAGTLFVTPGETLYIYVNFGAGSACQYQSVGGGGASDIRQGGNALTNRVAVAGGGGGSNSIIAGTNQCVPVNGGAGGGLTGATSGQATGGSQTAGGVTAGSFGYGGTYNCGGTQDSGSGGGGGWYGGGAQSQCYSGGGGGSSYFTPTGLLSQMTQGSSSAARVIITYIANPPTSQPTARPSLQPSVQPSSGPSSQPSSQPSANPTYNNEMDSNPESSTTLVGYAYSSGLVGNAYSTSYTFTNLGNQYPLYLQIDAYNAQFIGGQGGLIVTSVTTTSGQLAFVSNDCLPPLNNLTCAEQSFYRCNYNIPVLNAYMLSETGGSIQISTTTQYLSNVQCPYQNQYPLAMRYTLVYNHPIPTPLPTSAPVSIVVVSLGAAAISIGNTKTTLPIVAGVACLCMILGLWLYFTRRRETHLYMVTYMSILEMMLLGSQVVSEYVLIFFMISFGYQAFVYCAIVLIALRALKMIPLVYIVRRYAIMSSSSAPDTTDRTLSTESSSSVSNNANKNNLMDTIHLYANSKLYAILLIFAVLQLQIVKFLPWRETNFVRTSNGLPNFHVFCIVTFSSLLQVGLSTIFQTVFLVYVNSDASFSASLTTIYASAILANLSLLLTVVETVIIYYKVKFLGKQSPSKMTQEDQLKHAAAKELGGSKINGDNNYENGSEVVMAREVKMVDTSRLSQQYASAVAPLPEANDKFGINNKVVDQYGNNNGDEEAGVSIATCVVVNPLLPPSAVAASPSFADYVNKIRACYNLPAPREQQSSGDNHTSNTEVLSTLEVLRFAVRDLNLSEDWASQQNGLLGQAQQICQLLGV